MYVYINKPAEMGIRTGIALFTVILLSLELKGQPAGSEPGGPQQVLYPGGISLRYGMSAFALTDRYISPERYDGVLPNYYIAWARVHNRYLYHLSFAFGQSEKISNYSVRTRVQNFRLSQGFLYPLRPAGLFRKDLDLWIGPTTDIFYYVNHPKIAVSGFDYTNSYATLISLGFRGDGIYPLSGRFSVRTSLQFTLLSLGMRTVDSEEDPGPGVKFLTPVSGLNTSFELGIHYDPLRWVSLGLSYRFELTRITAWDDMLYASNGGFLELKFRF
jgi:hypothetical protein